MKPLTITGKIETLTLMDDGSVNVEMRTAEYRAITVIASRDAIAEGDLGKAVTIRFEESGASNA